MNDEFEEVGGLLAHQEPHHEGDDEAQFGGRSRVEVISGGNERRKWTPQEKARITRESFAPAVRVADVARRHRMSEGLLHQWRKIARDAGRVGPTFIPVQVDDQRSAPPTGRGSIEVELGGATIRVNGAVDADLLRVVLAAVRLRG
jgi:transposase